MSKEITKQLDQIIKDNFADEPNGHAWCTRHDILLVNGNCKGCKVVKEIEHTTQSDLDRAVREALEKAHRANNGHDYDNETDEYIDEMLEALQAQPKEDK